MKFLVVGASGFLGRHVLSYIQQSGYEALGTQSGEPRGPQLVTFNLLMHRIQECISPAFLKSDKKLFVVICAALSQMDKCFNEKELSYRINVERTMQLIKDVRGLNATPVFISTNCVYNGRSGYYNEDAVHDPISEYGRHKEALEQFLEAHVPEALVLRLDKIVSDEMPGKHMFAQWYQCLEDQQPIVCFDQVFSPTYAGDIANAIVRGCQLGLEGTYNVSNTEFFTRIELAKQFMAAVGKKVDVILKTHAELNFVDWRIKYAYMDSTRFIKKTGIGFTSLREVFHSLIKKAVEGREVLNVQASR